MSSGEKIAKLAGRLDAIDEKIDNMKQERVSIVDQISTIIVGAGGTVTPAAKTSKKEKAPSMGDLIVSYLLKSPGKTLQDIAEYLKQNNQPIGLSLSHLTKKGAVFSENGKYYSNSYAAVTEAAAKTAKKTSPEDEEVPF